MKRKIYNPVIFWPKEPRLGQATPGKVSYQWVIWTQCPSAWILCAWSGHHGISMPPHQHRKYDRTIISYALDQESYNQCWYEELKHCLRPHPFFSGFIIQRLSSYEHKVRWNHLWDTNTGKQIQTKDWLPNETSISCHKMLLNPTDECPMLFFFIIFRTAKRSWDSLGTFVNPDALKLLRSQAFPLILISPPGTRSPSVDTPSGSRFSIAPSNALSSWLGEATQNLKWNLIPRPH